MSDPPDPSPSTPPTSGADRRSFERFDVSFAVDYASGDTFLFAYLANISEMGIFLRTEEPLAMGTELRLRFAPPDGAPLEMDGLVVWINHVRPGGDNPNPGMGVRFVGLTSEQRERVVQLVRAIAYLHGDGGETHN